MNGMEMMLKSFGVDFGAINTLMTRLQTELPGIIVLVKEKISAIEEIQRQTESRLAEIEKILRESVTIELSHDKVENNG